MFKARPLERPDRLKDLAYREIRKQILSGGLDPARLYSAHQFAAILGVSRTPVREALLELAAEGLLALEDGRGFRLRPSSEKEIRDFFETRRVLETYVVGRLAGRLPPGHLRELDDHLALLGKLAGRDAPAFLEADREFHLGLVRRLDNRFLESVMEEIRNRIALFGLKALSLPGRPQEVIREHARIVRALRSARPSEAARAMEDHLASTESRVLQKMKGEPP
jgi:DNA-binding GntR family transcriptional regulator